MEVFSKIRNTLSSTVSDIAAALPGNPLLREYDTGNQVASAGPAYLWKLYDGVKKSTKAEVSIFIFEKKQLDQYPRGQRDTVLAVARKGASQLTKLRHPRVLTVEHAVEESRDSLVFCTEPVFASLGNVLGKRLNMSDMPEELISHQLFDIEIKYGILQISEGLSFLHDSAKMLHGNLCPESIIINKQGVWKLAGFDFCILNSNPSSEPKFTCPDWDTSLPPPALPNPCYLAPEIITEKRCDFASDLFSLGALLYSIYYSGKSLLQCSIQDVYRTMSQVGNKLRNMSDQELGKVPPEVREHEKMLIHPDASVRPDADQMSKLPYFEDIGVVTLQYLDNILQQDNLQKSQFFKGLGQVLAKLPKRVVLQRVLPSLTAEFHVPEMIPFVLPNVLMIAEDCDNAQYEELIFPSLVPVFKIQSPVQVLLILLQKMDLLLKKTPHKLVQAHLLPMLCNALDAPSLQTQELCLSIIPTFAQQLDSPSMKNSIISRIQKIVLTGGTISVRINALVCTGKLLPMFDKWFVFDEIFSFLFQVKSREPGILMAVLGIFQIAFSHKKLGITKDILAGKVIPFLLPISIETNLNLQQFSSFMVLIKDMLQKVESEQQSKLEQLSQMNVDGTSIADFKKLAMKESVAGAIKAEPVKVDDIFQAESNIKPKANDTEIQATRQHLTLEEKQRLAKAKEQEFRMKQQGPIKPISVSQMSSKTKPKDLTSTLTQRNLNKFAGRTTNPSTDIGTNAWMTTNPIGNSISGGISNSTTTQLNQNQRNSSAMSNNWSKSVGGYQAHRPIPSGPSFSTNNFSQQHSARMPFTNPNMPNPNRWQTPSPGCSLDSLLAMPSQTKPQAMNQMPHQYGMQQRQMMPSQPMHNSSSNMNAFTAANPFIAPHNTNSNPTNSSNPLSKQDLLDFLG